MNPVTTATMGVALMSGTAAAYAYPPLVPAPQGRASLTLASDVMSSAAVFVRITASPVEVSPEMGAVIHSALLGAFEHQYDL